MHKDMEGRVVLITGAGNGIGRETARQMAARGAVVGINDLKPEFVDVVVQEIREHGGNAFGVVQERAHAKVWSLLYNRLYTRAGVLMFWSIMRHGCVIRLSPDIQLDTVERMLDVGFKGVIWGIQAAAAAMDAERGGAIVNVASMLALRSTLNSVVYSGIKAGILGITRAAAAELGRASYSCECRMSFRRSNRRYATQS